jgi:homoserine O-acetyltransferase/O-succinyltransferase
MGGMQTWLWGEMFPNGMDCLVVLASTPAAISGRNMIWRKMVSQAIRDDPSWKNGNYPKDSPKKLDQCGHTVIRNHDRIT